MKWKNKKYLMKFYVKTVSVLVKLEFRQKIKCQTSLKEGKREEKLPVERRGFLPERGIPQGGREGGKPLIPRKKAQKKA